MARWVVTAGGMSVIAAIFGIVGFIVIEVLPLMKGADVEVTKTVPVSGMHTDAMLVDEYRELAATMSASGELRIVRIADAQTIAQLTLPAQLTSADVVEDTANNRQTTSRAILRGPHAPRAAKGTLAAATKDGAVVVVPVAWETSFDQDGVRHVDGSFGTPVRIDVDEASRPLIAFALHAGAGGSDRELGTATVIAQLEDLSLVVARRSAETNDFTGETEISVERNTHPPLEYEVLGFEIDDDSTTSYAIVVGIAMGFAVIPIVFSLSEEAFSSVPRNLVSGSLALGATRWQTVASIVVPTASPGVFAAVMVGFGRAVGETMVVLMATGNTPILDWSPFNGFRTLSANIGVEIPEASHGGTLYRTLFLSALILFALTFAVNTIAEIVRLRLRRRFGQL